MGRPATNTLIALAELSVAFTNAHANQDIMEAGTQEDAIVCIDFIFAVSFHSSVNLVHIRPLQSQGSSWSLGSLGTTQKIYEAQKTECQLTTYRP